MVCQKCGTQVTDGTVICPTCGNVVASQNTYGQQSGPQPYGRQQTQQPYGYQQQANVMTTVSPTNVLVLGIVALSLAWEPIASIAAIVLGAIAMAKANRYYAEGGVFSGKVKTGRILGMVGMISGIVMTVIYFCAILIDL